MKYSKWDEIVLKVDDSFGYRDKVFSRMKIMIIGFDTDCIGDQSQYLCYIPSYVKIPYGFPSFTIDRHHVKHYKLENKFIGDEGCFITARDEIYEHIPIAKGEQCKLCKTWFEGVEINCDDDNTYACRSCKENPYRLFNHQKHEFQVFTL